MLHSRDNIRLQVCRVRRTLVDYAAPHNIHSVEILLLPGTGVNGKRVLDFHPGCSHIRSDGV
jgi:hypothetical protein